MVNNHTYDGKRLDNIKVCNGIRESFHCGIFVHNKKDIRIIVTHEYNLT